MLRILMSGYLILALFTQNFVALANEQYPVVISELAWAGSVNNSSDEWIELYNNTSADIDLAGWKIIDDGTTEYLITAGTIKAHDYFLIASNQSAAGVEADFVKSLSLANAGDYLMLVDATGATIDQVNADGGAWPAGDATSKQTMERIDTGLGGALSTNWKSSENPGGTPKAGVSSGGTLPEVPPVKPTNTNIKISLETSKTTFAPGEEFQITGKVTDSESLFAYGLDLVYDPSVLSFISAQEGDFFAQSSYESSFQAGLQNSEEGHLVLADSLIKYFDENIDGLNGEGDLFTLTFKVIGENGTTFDFANTSFAADTNSEMPLNLSNLQITVVSGGSGSNPEFKVINLVSGLGAAQYSLQLNWDAPSSGADKYQIFRLDTIDQYTLLAETTDTHFLDDDSKFVGGALVPNHEYQYKIVPVQGSQIGEENLITATETRGIKGDNDRSNRVDGRDLYQLALIYGVDISFDGGGGYSALVDTTYDGVIDGDDLLDITSNWALTYGEN